MIKYCVKKYKIMYEEAAESGGSGASEEMLGFNVDKIETLKTAVDTSFKTLTDQTTLLADMEKTVQGCWIGPDAESYLDSVFAKANELVQTCGEAYDRINTTINEAKNSWSTFQSTNKISV